ncbi:MAG: hypothetical protein ABJJ03_11710, partial [Sulfitobacter sp.]
VWRAHVADKYVKKLRKLHPNWGDGSLRAAAQHVAQTKHNGSINGEYVEALAVVISAVSQCRGQPDQFCDLKRVCITDNSS